MPLKWKNSRSDGLPQHNQRVLVSVNGINYDTKYDAISNVFTAIKFDTIVFSPVKFEIYWSENWPSE